MHVRRWCIPVVMIMAGVPDGALGNGGPFVVKYPQGDPAAKGVLARLDPDLKPGREERLRVIREDLRIWFLPNQQPGSETSNASPSPVQSWLQAPLVMVTAAYTIENPTDEEVSVDFGFPILRGIYIHPFSMMPRPEAQVQLDGKDVNVGIISNSLIYGIIRQRCREAIDKALAADPKLAELVARLRASSYVRQRAREAVKAAIAGDAAVLKAANADAALNRIVAIESDTDDAERKANRQALLDYLTGPLRWNPPSATLMVEFCSLETGPLAFYPHDRVHGGFDSLSHEAHQLTNGNLGRLSAIGEQKATQLFAELAARFDPQIKTAYESIFAAWGGDVRERSIDIESGELRPREITVDPRLTDDQLRTVGMSDPTIYARVDYLAPNESLSAAEKLACQAILKNLPVIFTFAPMNLLHYQAAFPKKTTRTLSVTYRQYAFLDTRGPSSYQLAYVVHPASLWKEFGPIEVEIMVPENAQVKASIECPSAGVEELDLPQSVGWRRPGQKMRMARHRATLHEKTGEFFVAVEAESWSKAVAAQPDKTVAVPPQPPPPATARQAVR